MVPSLTPYDPPSPQMGVPYAPTYANGHISATGDPIHFMFGSRVGFRGRGIERRYLRFEQIQDGGHRTAMLEKFQAAISLQPVVYLHNGSRSTYIARIARSFLQ